MVQPPDRATVITDFVRGNELESASAWTVLTIGGMASRETIQQRGRRLARDLLRRLGVQVRIARVSAGLSQRELGRLVGVSHQTIGRIERAEVPSLALDRIVLLATMLGLDLQVGLHPSGSPARDAAHLALLARLRDRLGPGTRFRMEVPMPTAGDLRSADGLILESEFDAMVEAETQSTTSRRSYAGREPSSATSAVDVSSCCSVTVDITATCSVCIRSCSWTFLCRRESDFGRSLRAGTQAVT